MIELEEHVSLQTAALLLDVDRSTIKRWVKQGKLGPVYRLGRRCTRLPASGITRFLEERRVEHEQ